MATVVLTKDTFTDTVRRDGIVLVDFWAQWCGPCRSFAPVFERASEDHADIVFGSVDIEAEPDLAQTMKVRSIPTVMAFRDGILVFSQPGALPQPALAKVIDAVRALDMDAIRARALQQRWSA